jgi:hypothetical protein
MKLNALALMLAVSAAGVVAADAQVIIEERRDPAIVIERDRPETSVTIEERRGILDREKTITRETTGAGVDCESKTVHKKDVLGSKTTTKTECD